MDSQAAFGRSDVQRVLGLKPTRSLALIREMAKGGIIEPISGYGKENIGFGSSKIEIMAFRIYFLEGSLEAVRRIECLHMVSRQRDSKECEDDI